MVKEWEENIHFKVLYSRAIDFSSSGPMNQSSCRSWFLDHYINRIRSTTISEPQKIIPVCIQYDTTDTNLVLTGYGLETF